MEVSRCYQRLAAAESCSSSTSTALQTTAATTTTTSFTSSSGKRTAIVGKRNKQTSSTASSSAVSAERIACYIFIIVACLWFSAIAILVSNLDSEIGLRTSNSNRNRTAAMELLMRQRRGYHILPKYPINHQHLRTQLSSRAIQQCNKALWHTLETTTTILPNNETFVITGDIPDLWLRDSAAQIHPLLIPNVYYDDTIDTINNNNHGNGNSRLRTKSLIRVDTKLERIVSGLILKTARYIRYDPYANAFKIHDHEPYNDFDRDVLGRHGYIATWNYELDSACYYMRMIYYFYLAFPFHPILRMVEVKNAIEIMMDVWISEQAHELDVFPNGTLFDCISCGKPYRYNPNELERNGKGGETAPNIGLTWSGFRPSDDPCKYGYHIPSNMFAVVVLKYMEEMFEMVWIDEPLMKKARKLRTEINDGIQRHGIVEHEVYGMIYAYEVDGLGNVLLEDDANVPSLLSIPYLGYDYNPTIFDNTKRFILSSSNPWYHGGMYEGVSYSGIGSPHTHFIEQSIWPMAMIMEGLISNNATYKAEIVEKLLVASAGTGWMHESFSANNPNSFSRPWFCWPDSLFAELVISLTDKCPPIRRREIINRGGSDGDDKDDEEEYYGVWYNEVKQQEQETYELPQEMIIEKPLKPYCGFCHGAAEFEGQCCNTCNDVMVAHIKKGLDPNLIKLKAKQCQCGSCYGAHEFDGQCCSTCDELVAAYSKMSWDVTELKKTAEQCVEDISENNVVQAIPERPQPVDGEFNKEERESNENDVETVMKVVDEKVTACGSCYEAQENVGDCCNTCDDLLTTYKNKGLDNTNIQRLAKQCLTICGDCYDDTTDECCNTCDDVIFAAQKNKQRLDMDHIKSIAVKAPQCTCGYCHGAAGHEGDCCNTCDDLISAYKMKGWEVTNIRQMAEQCVTTDATVQDKVQRMWIEWKMSRRKSQRMEKFQQRRMKTHEMVVALTKKFDEVSDEEANGADAIITAAPLPLSRNPGVIITSSTRGNLGPASVLNQNPPGTDWLKDRWQAASDMGGTAIPGRHWILLDLSSLAASSTILVTKVVLDWETAYAKDYRIEGRIDPPPPPPTLSNNKEKNDDDGKWCTLYDGALDDVKKLMTIHRSVEEYGQSPGVVSEKLPLHIVHTINFTTTTDTPLHGEDDNNLKCRTLRYLRVYINNPARGWGVSLWQVDVYGETNL